MYQGILLSDSNLLADLKADHLKTLSAPLDRMLSANMV